MISSDELLDEVISIGLSLDIDGMEGVAGLGDMGPMTSISNIIEVGLFILIIPKNLKPFFSSSTGMSSLNFLSGLHITSELSISTSISVCFKVNVHL